MSKLSGLSFIEKGAEAEQRFMKMADKYLAGQESFGKLLEDGTHILIRKQSLNSHGEARFINIYDNQVGYEFTLYPIANADSNSQFTGLKVSIRTLNMPETTLPFDSGDLSTLEQFLTENI